MAHRDLRHSSLGHKLAEEDITHAVIGAYTNAQKGTLDRLVDAVRLQQRSSSARHEPVPLRPLFAELASEFAGPAELKGIKLRVRPVSAVVSGHPALLSGILRDLTRNAIDYTPCGGRVLVACRRRGSEAH
jgi:two-component system CheB/CheR fusion protein